MGDLSERLRKVRRACTIASIVVCIVVVVFTLFKVGLVGHVVNSGVEYLVNQKEIGSNDSASGIIGIAGAFLGGLGAIVFWFKAFIEIVLVDGLIWIGYLIYYLVNKEKAKKNTEIDVKIE